MHQMTVEKLYKELKVLVDQGMGNKAIVVANDNEGNGFHGCFYSCTTDAKTIKDAINCTYLYDSCELDPNNLVIVG